MRDAREMLVQAQRFQDDGDYYSLRRTAEWIIVEAERVDDKDSLGRALMFLGVAEMRTGDPERARDLLTQAATLFEECGNPVELARAKMNLGTLAFDVRGDIAEAKRLYQEVLPLVEETHDELCHGIALANIAEICRYEGKYDDALAFARNALEKFSSCDSAWRHALTLVTLAHVHALRGEIDEAVRRMEEAREVTFASSNPTSMAIYCEVYGFIALAHGDIDAAALVLHFVSKYREHYDLVEDRSLAPWRRLAEAEIARVRTPEERESLRARASHLGLDEICGVLARALTIPT